MLEKEELNIMYPTKWPDDIKLVSVKSFVEVTGHHIIRFSTNSSNISVSVTLNHQIEHNDPDETYIHNNITYVLGYNQWHYATWNYNNNQYYISADTKDDLIMIIENMKEFTK